MQVEVKNFTSPDIEDLRHFVPADKQSFAFLLELTIGIKGKEGGDEFSFEVCTPKWLLDNHQHYEVLFGRHKLIVFKYDIDNILNSLALYLSSLNGSSWDEIAKQISNVGQWEFENYKS